MVPGGIDLPGRIENVTTAAAVLAAAERVERTAAGRPFLLRIEDQQDRMKWVDVGVCPWGWGMMCMDDYEPNTSDYFVTRGESSSNEEWEFEQPSGQTMWLSRKSFVDSKRLKRALVVYLSTRKLWRGINWEPTPDPLLMIDDPIT